MKRNEYDLTQPLINRISGLPYPDPNRRADDGGPVPMVLYTLYAHVLVHPQKVVRPELMPLAYDLADRLLTRGPTGPVALTFGEVKLIRDALDNSGMLPGIIVPAKRAIGGDDLSAVQVSDAPPR